ncbi:hypothetical protein B0H19DRAFT_1190403 [Mycena capillaripes]|nr:hypothetical protein B0H19DRAFT_1190403 [Mycena capillaripes]
MQEPTSSSLVTAVLPEDLMIAIVEDAARDTPTALSLALVSKAIGRMAESVLYSSINLGSFTATRTFTATMRTKRRPILACVVELVLTIPAPKDYEDFWALVDERCPHIERLSVVADDLDALKAMRIQPNHLFVLGGRSRGLPSAAADASLGAWGRVSHLYLSDHSPAFLSALVPTGCFAHLTHLSCTVQLEVLAFPQELDPLRLFLGLPTLRMCVVYSPLHRGDLFADMFLRVGPLIDRRLVVIFASDLHDGMMGDAPHWEFAEKEIAGRPSQ